MAKGVSVLVVDDDALVRELLASKLSKAGYLPFCAAGGAEGLALLAQENIGLVLLDIMMPGLSGLEVMERIRCSWPDLAVIMATSEDDPAVAQQALSLGARGYLVKPFGDNELLIYLAQVLRLQEAERDNRTYRANLEHLIKERTAELGRTLEDLKSTQNQLIQQEKLATIGHLAAGVAHEINNPTGYIGSNLGTMGKYFDKFKEFIALQDQAIQGLPPEKVAELGAARQKLKLDFLLEDSRELVSESLEGIEKIKKIVQGLKSFSRKEQDEARPVNLNECLDNALTVAWNELKYKATVEKIYGDIPLVSGFPNQLGQVFINLLVNAAQALDGQGTITLRTGREGDAVVVAVSDTGCGIPEASREKIFEPFFTTKANGVGTGLGLSIIKEIVTRHQGEIALESEPGKGTTFTIRLPARV